VDPDMPFWLWWLLPTAFGVGAALVLDEFALWLNLRDVYWTREGLLSVQITLAVTALLASIALTRNEPKIAMHFLDTLNPRQSKDIEVLTMYGDALMRLKRYTDANSILSRADKIAAPGSSALFRLVTVRLRGGQNADAIKLLKAELARNPDAAGCRWIIGWRCGASWEPRSSGRTGT